MKYPLKVKNNHWMMLVKQLIIIKLIIKIPVRLSKYLRIRKLQEFIIHKTNKLKQIFQVTIFMKWLKDKNNINEKINYIILECIFCKFFEDST